MRDLVNNLKTVLALSPAVQAATIKGNTIDLLGYDSCMFVFASGAIVGAGAFGPSIQESDTTTDGDFAHVDDADLLLPDNLPAAFAADSIVKVGYVGTKRYVRCVVTKGSGTSVAVGASAILGGGTKPVA
jgi:hypothetical protein